MDGRSANGYLNAIRERGSTLSKRSVLPLVVAGILAVLATLLVIGLVVGDKTDQEQEEDRRDAAPARVTTGHISVHPAPASVLRAITPTCVSGLRRCAVDRGETRA